jgi:hypothetical protein
VTGAAKFRTIVRSTFAAGLLGPPIGAALAVAAFGESVPTIPDIAVAGIMLVGPVAALGGLAGGGIAIVLAQHQVNIKTKGTWVGRGLTVGVATGAGAILLAASVMRAWGSGVVWAYAELAAVSGGMVGALVALLTWPDVLVKMHTNHQELDHA